MYNILLQCGSDKESFIAVFKPLNLSVIEEESVIVVAFGNPDGHYEKQFDSIPEPAKSCIP